MQGQRRRDRVRGRGGTPAPAASASGRRRPDGRARGSRPARSWHARQPVGQRCRVRIAAACVTTGFSPRAASARPRTDRAPLRSTWSARRSRRTVSRRGYDAAGGIAVPAQVLGGGVDHRVHAEAGRVDQEGSGEGVVDDGLHAVSFGDLDQRRECRRRGPAGWRSSRRGARADAPPPGPAPPHPGRGCRHTSSARRGCRTRFPAAPGCAVEIAASHHPVARLNLVRMAVAALPCQSQRRLRPLSLQGGTATSSARVVGLPCRVRRIPAARAKDRVLRLGVVGEIREDG